ncbi:hypothetical protein HK101_001784 [Irineochytrium annulatum]|nr:hypothetical protein HK101_001784 [Irineochytrium annulatum]
MSPSDMRKLCAKLRDDGMLKIKSKTEVIKEFRHTKNVTQAHYYIDYKHFVNVVRYKIRVIQQTIQKEVEKKNNEQSYICNTCDASYELLTAIATLDHDEEGLFLCETCKTPLDLKEMEDLENDRSKKFNTALKPFEDLLKTLETVTIPDFEPTALANGTTKGKDKDIAYSTETGAAVGEIVVEFEGQNLDNVEFDTKDDGYYGSLFGQAMDADVKNIKMEFSLKRESEPEASSSAKRMKIEEDSEEDEEFEEV